jgi:hypothetical protein
VDRRAPRQDRHKQFVVDATVMLGVDGVTDFNALHSRRSVHHILPILVTF